MSACPAHPLQVEQGLAQRALVLFAVHLRFGQGRSVRAFRRTVNGTLGAGEDHSGFDLAVGGLGLVLDADEFLGSPAERIAHAEQRAELALVFVHFIDGILGFDFASRIVSGRDVRRRCRFFLFRRGGRGSLLRTAQRQREGCGEASARAVVNTSPEPVSNAAVSTVEDVATIGLLWLAYEYPWAAGAIALVVLGLCVWGLIWARRVLRRLFWKSGPKTHLPPQEG